MRRRLTRPEVVARNVAYRRSSDPRRRRTTDSSRLVSVVRSMVTRTTVVHSRLRPRIATLSVMTNLDGVLDLIPISDIAKQFGISEDVAEAAVKQIIPTIVGGMAANAKDSSGAASLEKALTKHTSTSGKKVSVKDIDTADGEKIVNNVFGAKKSEVAAAVADSSSGDVTKELIAKLLPVVAPIVIAFIAQQFLGQKTAAPAAEEPKAAPASSGGIGDLLGGLLGSSQGQEVLGSVLGGLLGGGKK